MKSMDNKIIGISDLVTGFVGILIQIGLLGTRTKLISMYSVLELPLPPITVVFPYLIAMVICYCFFVIYIGLRLILIKEKNEKLLKKGIFNLIFAVILLGLFSIVSAVSLIFPLYNATSYL